MQALLRIIAKLGGNETQAENSLYNWGYGSTWIDPSPAQCEALGIRSEEPL
jgi:hypothetical protein